MHGATTEGGGAGMKNQETFRMTGNAARAGTEAKGTKCTHMRARSGMAEDTAVFGLSGGRHVP